MVFQRFTTPDQGLFLKYACVHTNMAVSGVGWLSLCHTGLWHSLCLLIDWGIEWGVGVSASALDVYDNLPPAVLIVTGSTMFAFQLHAEL
jgi:hypothetical protein